MANFIKTSDDFLTVCNQVISNEITSKFDKATLDSMHIEISAVWFSKYDQTYVGVFDTTLPDLKYYLIVYDGVTNTLSFDTYIKFDTKIYKIGAPQENTESDEVGAENTND